MLNTGCVCVLIETEGRVRPAESDSVFRPTRTLVGFINFCWAFVFFPVYLTGGIHINLPDI